MTGGWFDWTALSKDPNDPATRARMRDYLVSIRRLHPDLEMLAFLEDHVRGRRLLDVGVVSHTALKAEEPHWRHAHLARCASFCLGIDVLEPEIEALRRRGFNVLAVDATSDRDLGERFDVVFLGDVIEHVDRPVALLAFARRHLSGGGLVLATTPNPFSRRFFRSFRKNGVPIANLDHVSWITPTAAMELGRRARLELRAYHLVRRFPPHHLWLKRLIWHLRPAEFSFSHYAYEYRAAGDG